MTDGDSVQSYGVAGHRLILMMSAAIVVLVLANTLVLTTWLVTNASDVPFGDMIRAMAVAKGFLDGDQGLISHLFQPHNTHLMVTSRPLFLLDLWLGGGRGYLLVALNLLLLLALAAGSAGLTWVALVGHIFPFRLALSAMAAGLWLNAHQLMNLNWGFQVAHFMLVALGLGTALAIALMDAAADQRTSRRLMLVISAMIVLSGLTMGVGVVFGPLALVMALILRWKWQRLLVLAVPTMFVMAIYLVLVPIADIPARPSASRDPVAIAQFIVLFMGGAFLRLTEWPSNFPFWLGFRSLGFVFGLVILSLGAGAFLVRLRHPRAGGGIVTIGLAAIGIALGAAILGAGGRLSAGVNEAANQKYVAISMLGWLGALFIVVGALRILRARLMWAGAVALPAAALVLLAFISYTQLREYVIFSKWNARLQESATALQFKSGDLEYYNTLWFDPVQLEAVDNGVILSGRKAFRSTSRPQPADRLLPDLIAAGCFGGIDAVLPVPDPKRGTSPAFRLQGWSWIVPERAPARWIVVLNAANEVVGLATPTRRHPIVDELVFAEISAFQPAGFFGFIVPRGAGPFRAIGLTADKRRGCAMGAFQL